MALNLRSMRWISAGISSFRRSMAAIVSVACSRANRDGSRSSVAPARDKTARTFSPSCRKNATTTPMRLSSTIRLMTSTRPSVILTSSFRSAATTVRSFVLRRNPMDSKARLWERAPSSGDNTRTAPS